MNLRWFHALLILLSEKKLIYAVLGLTVVFFVALMALPIATVHDSLGIH